MANDIERYEFGEMGGGRRLFMANTIRPSKRFKQLGIDDDKIDDLNNAEENRIFDICDFDTMRTRRMAAVRMMTMTVMTRRCATEVIVFLDTRHCSKMRESGQVEPRNCGKGREKATIVQALPLAYDSLQLLVFITRRQNIATTAQLHC